MARRESISISFTPEQAEFLASLVDARRVPVRQRGRACRVRPFQHRHAVMDAELDRARREIEAGAGQLDEGRTVEGDAFFAEWDAELDELEARS